MSSFEQPAREGTHADRFQNQYERILDLYIESLKQQRSDLMDAIASLDMDVLEDLVHRMKGTGACYGYPDVSAWAGHCQRLLRDRHWSRQLDDALRGLLIAVGAACG